MIGVRPVDLELVVVEILSNVVDEGRLSMA